MSAVSFNHRELFISLEFFRILLDSSAKKEVRFQSLPELYRRLETPRPLFESRDGMQSHFIL